MRRPSLAVASALVLAVLVSVVSCSGSPLSAGTPADPPSSSTHGSNYLLAIGALFLPGQKQHYCTASVVDSGSGDVVMTAAHCLAGSGRGLLFDPGYGADGSGPSGRWTVTATYAPPEWLKHQDAAHDYAFLSVTSTPGSAPPGSPRTVEGAVGSVGTPGPVRPGRPVTVVGYKVGDNDQQLICTSPVSTSGGAPTVHCTDLGIGTSGGPWITQPADQPAAGGLVGLVGGPHQGGCTSQVSYSPVFDADTTALLRRASAGGPGDTLPIPGDDGC